MKFESLVPLSSEQALDIHEDPPDAWDSVAIVSFWSFPAKVRKRWPHAAVIGPLRTVEGVDLFLRNLLHNPQITRVVLAGQDLNEVTKEILRVWQTKTTRAPDLSPHVALIVESVTLFDEGDDLFADRIPLPGEGPVVTLPVRQRVVLHPPKPVVSSTAKPGDPGDRIAGMFLQDVWPVALRRILDVGAKHESQYGDALELLNLVTVLRDPKQVLDEEELETVGLSAAQVDKYTLEDFTGEVIREDATYGYGARMADQAPKIQGLLNRAPETRAAYLTPWDPAKDSGRESGRPCLVGVWFRRYEDQLTLTVSFRSHDMFKGYCLNMAAACRWLLAEAERVGCAPGPVTCVSHSAHLYDNSWAAARAVIDKARVPSVRWDMRALWSISRVVEKRPEPALGDTVWVHQTQKFKVEYKVGAFDWGERWCIGMRPSRFVDHDGVTKDVTPQVLSWLGLRDGVDWWDLIQWSDAIGWRPRITYRAEVRDPRTRELVAVLEAPNGAQLRKAVGESGLIQEVSNALWIGGEITRLAGEDE